MSAHSDFMAKRFGGPNWVIAQRTANVVRKYGEDVICISQKTYSAAEKAWEIRNAENHPAYPYLKKLFGNHCDAVNVIRGLREEGFRIEQLPEHRR